MIKRKKKSCMIFDSFRFMDYLKMEKQKINDRNIFSARLSGGHLPENIIPEGNLQI